MQLSYQSGLLKTPVLLSSTLFMVCLAISVWGQTSHQPRVSPGPGEPDWKLVLSERYGLSLFGDLLNPVMTTAASSPGLFRKAGAGPVTYTPVVALGLATRNRGGWYLPPSDGDEPRKSALWKYTFKNTAEDLKTGKNLPPPLEEGSTSRFDPGDQPFGFWVSNDEFSDGGVFTEPALVARINKRLAAQPYKAMIYPNRDKNSGRQIPNSYIIGWEYSNNDDFQDIVCQVDNAVLVHK
jgi:hypothetical protein